MQRQGTMPTALQSHRFRRSVPYYLQPDYKLHEFNKRLQNKSSGKADQQWWDELINEFFEDDASLLLQYKEKSHTRKYNIHRRLIPRYFRSLFEGGVTKVHFVVLETKENYMNTSVTLDCKHASMITHYGKPNETKVQTDGHLSIEFSFDEFMRIRNWKFNIKENTELVSRSAVTDCKGDQAKYEELSTSITEHGLSPATLQYLRIGVILEPMQEIMSRQKSYGISPRDALKSVLVDKWQAHIFNQDFEQRNRPWNVTAGRGRGGAPKRRKPRKPSTDSKAGVKKKSPVTGASAFPAFNQSDVMLVNEPMIMGGKCGEEDERLITRLENAQFSNANGTPMDDVDEAFAPSGGMELPISSSSQPWKNVEKIKEEKKD